MTVLHVYDEIGAPFGLSAGEFAAQLGAAGPGDVEIRLNSPGGDVFDGLAMYNSLTEHPGQVTVIVDGLAASIASVVAMAASPRRLLVAPSAVMMIHPAWSVTAGPAADHRAKADLLDRMSQVIAKVYESRTIDHDWMWLERMAAETWYVGQEAVDAGLADAVLAGRVPA